MSFRSKITAMVAVITVLVTFIVGFLAVRATEVQLEREVDRNLERLVTSPAWFGGPGTVALLNLLRSLGAPLDETEGRGTGPRNEPDSEPDTGSSPVVAQFETADGTQRVLVGDEAVAVPSGVLDDARGLEIVYFSTSLDGEPYRAAARSVRPTGWLVVALNTEEQERILQGLAGSIAVAGAVVAVGAGLIGWLAAGALVRPLRRLTEAAEQVTATGDLNTEVRTDAKDEAGRLSRSFDDMLGALAVSQQAQRQLVQDAGHELRTPIASIMSNAEVLERHADLDEQTRTAIATDLISESQELTALVNALVDLAGVADDREPPADAAASDLLAGALRRLPADDVARITVTGDGPVHARPAQVRRALVNVLSNAAKFAPHDTPIEVAIEAAASTTVIAVRDHGPGLTAEEQEHAFDRFWRADTARSVPGSGLGLAIVADVMRLNAGTASLDNHPDGGLVVRLTLPAHRPAV